MGLGYNKGYVSREHTMWCGLCVHWEQVAEPTMRSAIRYFRSQGWRKTKDRGWLCPKCVKKVKSGEVLRLKDSDVTWST